MTKRALILGGCGFIGSNVAKFLISRDWSVRVFDCARPSTVLAGVEYVYGDFFEFGAVENALQGCDAVIQSLGILNPGNSSERYMFGYTDEFKRNVELIDTATASGVRFILISSGGTVYLPSDEPLREDDPVGPTNHYGAMKLACEAACFAFSAQREVPAYVVRLANPYGPGQDYRRGVGFIDAAVKRSLAGELIEIWGDGSSVRDYVYVEDAAAAIFAVLTYEGNHRVFNVGTGEGVSQRAIIELLDRMGLMPQVSYLEARPVDRKSIVLDISRMRNDLGVRPRCLAFGLSRYVEELAGLGRQA